MRKGKFDLEDLADQLAQVEKIGGLGGLMGMLPGVGKLKQQMAAANVDDRIIRRQRAIILSMTPQERRNPDLLKASRKKRIAAGAGMKVEDLNRLLKQHRQMADMMKALGGAKKGRWARWRRCSVSAAACRSPRPSRSRRCRSRWAAA
jgi:signal recognition particle subunit SRP54